MPSVGPPENEVPVAAAGEAAPAQAPAGAAPVGEAAGEPGQVEPAQAAAPAAPAPGAPPGGEAEAPARPAEAPAKEPERQTIVIRYGAMGLMGRFTHALDAWRCGQRVVVKSDRGMEIATVVCAWGGCGAPAGISPQVKGEVLRSVSHADEVEERHLAESARREFQFCKECIAKHALPMKLVAVEHLFGGDRIVFHFVSESRVDFRALVRDLAHECQTRIEMRQIGVRDEARLLGDYERCGRPLCCRAWIKELEPVSMKMAKIQKATLDPTKISGRCGRLMCCLRFEHATYRDLARNLPRKNTLVMTPQGLGKVVDSDIVSQMVAVQMEAGTRVAYPVERIKPFEGSPGSPAVAPGPASAPPPEEELPDEDEAVEEEAPASRLAPDLAEPSAPPASPGPSVAAAASGPLDGPAAPPAPGAPAAPPAPGAPAAPPAPGAPGVASEGGRRNRRRRRSRRGRNRGRPPQPGLGGPPASSPPPPAGSPAPSQPPSDTGPGGP
jgi:cell fate regulator YaaT (PSP1 superfamily)